MNQRIIDSISLALSTAFPDYDILEDDFEQNIGRPSFYIRCTSSEPIDRIKWGGFFMEYGFEILFDPGSETPKEDCYAMESQLIYLLKRIPDIEGGYAFRPRDVQGKVLDGLLHYTFYITESVKYEPEDGTRIRIYDIRARIKRSRDE